MDADMEKVRRIMLEQQATFQEQLQELHRVYRVQKVLMLKARDQRTLELGGLSVKTEPDVTPVPAPPPRRRRTFDLERPAEEYMDVDGELDEPRIPSTATPTATPTTITTTNNNSNNRDLVYKLNGMVSAPSLDSSSSLPRAGIESPGFSNGRMLGLKSEKEAEFLHMLKRAKSSEEAGENKRAGGFGFLGALSSPWYGPLENGPTEKQSTPNGFHLGRGVVEDKGSKSHLQSELLPLHSKQSESSNQLLQIQQTAVFLDSGLNSGLNTGLSPGLNRLSSGSGSCSVSSTGIDPTFNLNPFLSAGVPDENAKYNSRLQNHVSYSNQGILIPCSSASSTSGSVRRDPVLEGLWWKSNQGFTNQSVVPPVVGSVPSTWPGPGFITNHSSGSFHHSAMLGIQTVVPGGFKEENGAGWLRGNNHGHNVGSIGGSSSPGFHYSASTPPKPPFKKPPKLILDGTTMELKQVDSNKPAPGPARHQPDSLVGEETGGVGERNSVDGGCFVDGGKMAEIPKPLETDLNLAPVSDKSSSEKQSGVLPGPAVCECPPQTKSLDQPVLEQDQGVAEIVQESGVGTGVVESCLSEATLGRYGDPVTCSCAQPGCRVCGKGTVEDGQMQINWKNGVDSSAPPREEVRENGEPPPPSGKKRRFKLLVTRETESGNRKKSEDGEISASRAAQPESSKPEHGGEGERKRRKSSLGNSTSNNNNNSKRSSSHHHHEPSKEPKMSPVSRHTKEKSHNGYSALDNSDDGANLAAEILVSLAPRSVPAPPPPADKNSNSSGRVHHKSRRKLIDSLPTGVTTNRPVSPSPKSSVEPKDGKKKKKKKTGKAKSPVDEDPPPKVSATSVKSVKLGQTTPTPQSDYPESGTEKTSSKHKKKLVSKKQQLQQQQQQQQQQVQNHSVSVPRNTKPSSSGTGGGNPSRGTTTINVVHSKTSRDGVHHHHHHHNNNNNNNKSNNNHHHHGNEKKRSHNNLSEHESLDHQAVHHQSGGNSSDEITEKGSEVEHEDSGWSRRSWGASARRKRMRRCKRSDL